MGKCRRHLTNGACKCADGAALAGAGALVFSPKDFRGANTRTRAAFVYGAGADFHLTHRIFMRGEYRGFVYNSPLKLPTLRRLIAFNGYPAG